MGNPTDEHLALIGKVAVLFGAIEYLLDEFIFYVAFKDPTEGRKVADTDEPFKKKLKAAHKAFQEKFRNDPERLEQWAIIYNRLRNLASDRNNILHSAWEFEDPP